MMAFQDELKAFGFFLISIIRDLINTLTKRFSYVRELFLGIGICLVLAIGYTGYRWFTISRDQTAQKAFSEYVQDYQLALKENNPQEWDRVAALFQFGRNHYRSTSLAPYFLVMQSDIQLRQGKRAEAITTISEALSELSDTNMKSLLSIKRALVRLDSDKLEIREEGAQELVTLARDADNPYHDMALFYLGRYYWATNKIEEAKKTWQELVDSRWMDSVNPSPWMHEAKTALAQLN